MKQFTTTTAPEEFIGSYGPDWREGLLTDHLEAFLAAGGNFRVGRSNVGWAITAGRGVPVVCSEIVRVDTEDGPVSGRCGANASAETGRCGWH